MAIRTRVNRTIIVAVTFAAVGNGVEPHALDASDLQPGGGRVAIVFGDRSSYREAAVAIERRLAMQGHESLLLDWPKDGDARADAIARIKAYRPTVVATGGVRTTRAVLEEIPDLPVVFFMIPNALDADFLAPGSADRKRIAGVPTDVPPDQQIAWDRRLRATGGSLGILHSDRSQKTVAALAEAARQQGLSVTRIKARKDDFARAIDTLDDHSCGSVLMVADAGVYNSASVQRMLLWGIRQKKPIFAFSENVVKAGAAAGWYCDRAAVGDTAAELIHRALGGEPIAEIGIHYVPEAQQAANRRTLDIIKNSFDSTRLEEDVLWLGGE